MFQNNLYTYVYTKTRYVYTYEYVRASNLKGIFLLIII